MSRRTPLALLALTLAAVPAAADFTVHRGATPADAARSRPAFSTATSPCADPGLTDGADAFYLVLDSRRRAVDLHAEADHATGTVRLSFDDGNPASAPVDPVLSQVTLSPASVPADGATAILVQVVPRDAGGLALGTGLAVSLDPAALWPGRPGAVSDRGDGTYEVEIVSNLPGVAPVTVAVEGIVLSSRPTAEFVALEVAGTDRDRAIALLVELAAPGGLLETLGETAARQDLRRAISLLTTTDGSLDDRAVRTALAAAVLHLSPDLLAGSVVLDLLLDAARLLAAHHLETATAACGPCEPGPGRPGGVCAAADALAEGDALRADPGGDPSAVVDAYARSIARSLQAEDVCSGGTGRPGRGHGRGLGPKPARP